MTAYQKTCELCNASFESSFRHAKFCEEHRKNEKPLRTPPEEAHNCVICRRILRACEVGLDRLVTQLKESPEKLKEAIDLSRRSYSVPVPEPPRYEAYVESYSLKIDKSRGLFRRDVFHIKSISKDSGLSESTIKRHIHQHLIPMRYLKKAGRGFTVDIGLGQPLPRYQIYYDETEVHWSDNIGYFGFGKEDIDPFIHEFEGIDNDLKAILERFMILWIRTRLRKLERILAYELMRRDTYAREKAVMIHGIELVLRKCLRTALSDLAPSLSESGRELSILEDSMDGIEDILKGDKYEAEQVEEIACSLQDPSSPLLRRAWVRASVNEVANAVTALLDFDAPTILIDRKLGHRAATLAKRS